MTFQEISFFFGDNFNLWYPLLTYQDEKSFLIFLKEKVIKVVVKEELFSIKDNSISMVVEF